MPPKAEEPPGFPGLQAKDPDGGRCLRFGGRVHRAGLGALAPRLFSLYPKSVRKGLSSLMDPVLEIMHQRIDMGSRNIRIMAKILGRIKPS